LEGEGACGAVTTLLVASSGGHLAQLVELVGRLPLMDSGRHWVTFRGPQSESLLAGERVTFVPAVRERDHIGILFAAARAVRMFAGERYRAVVSTGSGVALAFLPYAALLGIDAHYIESSSRVRARSTTGRLLSRFPRIRLYQQFPAGATSRWHYGGSVFDSFEPSSVEPRPIKRLVVTVGGHRAFRRLIERLVQILPPDVDALWQTGPTPVEDLGIQARPFLPALELEDAIRNADAVVAHAGCGSALTALKVGRCPVLVPRDPGLGEVVDDHQSDFAGALAERGLALCRTTANLTLADLEAAAVRAVVRVADPPPFRLAASS